MKFIVDLILLIAYGLCQFILKITSEKTILLRVLGEWAGARAVSCLSTMLVQIYTITIKIEAKKANLCFAFLAIVILPNPIGADEVQLLYFTDTCLEENCEDRTWTITKESPELKYYLVRNLDDDILALNESILNERGWANVIVLKPIKDDLGNIYWIFDKEFNALSCEDMEGAMFESGIFDDSRMQNDK
jgi:hypothetical protein